MSSAFASTRALTPTSEPYGVFQTALARACCFLLLNGLRGGQFSHTQHCVSRLIYGVDYDLNICGIDDAVKDKPLGAWPWPVEYDLQVCVDSCEKTKVESGPDRVTLQAYTSEECESLLLRNVLVPSDVPFVFYCFGMCAKDSSPLVLLSFSTLLTVFSLHFCFQSSATASRPATSPRARSSPTRSARRPT